MKQKKYKVKIDNGEIKPLEPIDLYNATEGIVIFFLDEEISKPTKDLKPLKEMIGGIDEEPPYKGLTPEFIDKVVYDEL